MSEEAIDSPTPWAKIAFAAILPNVGGWAGGIITKNNIKGWYENLQFPPYRPPNWLFGPVWTGLYTGMGYASYLVYRDGGGFEGEAKGPLALYATQLALNWAWTPIFFGAHNIKLAAIEILALTATAGATGFAFYRINKTAGLIFIPYMLWLTFASNLNFQIFRLNRKSIKDNDKKQ